MGYQHMKLFFYSHSIILLIVLYFSGTEEFNSYLLNSDALYLPTLMDDFRAGIPLNGWSLTPSPYFFPDMLIYGIISIFFNFKMSIIVFASIQYSLILVAHHLLLKALNLNNYKNTIIINYLLGIILLLLTLLFFPDIAYTSLVSANHTGNYILTVFSFAILINFLNKDFSIKNIVLLTAFSLAAITSDKLYTVTFLIPSATLLIINFKFKKVIYYLVGSVLLYIATSAFLGYFRNHFIFVPDASVFKIIFQNLSFHLFFDENLNISFLKITTPFIFILFLLLWFYHKTISPSRQNILLFYSFAVTVTLISFYLTGIVITKDFPLRYIQSIWLFWLFLLPIILTEKVTHIQFSAISFNPLIHALFILNIIFGLFSFISSQKINMDKTVSCLLNNPLSQCNGNCKVKYGIGDYWNSKKLTALSHRNIFVNQVTYDLDIYHWINNLEWYKNREYSFILPARLDKKKIVTLSGNPVTIANCNGTEIWFYKTNKLKNILNDHKLRQTNIPSAKLWLKKSVP